MDSSLRSLTVESYIEDVIRLHKVDVFIEELEALFVIDYTNVRFFLDAKAFATHFLDLPHRWSFFLVKVDKYFLIRLVHSSVDTDSYLNKFRHNHVSLLDCFSIKSTLNIILSQTLYAPISSPLFPLLISRFIGLNQTSIDSISGLKHPESTY